MSLDKMIGIALVLMVSGSAVAEDRSDDEAERRKVKQTIVWKGMQMAFQLLQVRPVGAELKLTDEQAKAIGAAGETHERLINEMFRAAEGVDEDIKRTALDKWEAGEGRDILQRTLRPEQYLRLSEIMWQRIGPTIFEEASKDLELTVRQRHEVAVAIETASKVVDELIKQGGFDEPQTVNDEYRAKYRVFLAADRTAKENATNSILGKLDQSQVAKYRELIGRPFDTMSVDLAR